MTFRLEVGTMTTNQVFFWLTMLSIIRGCFATLDDLNLSPDFIHAPFLHGVASADPLEDRVLIWTRISHFGPRDRNESVSISWAVWEKGNVQQSFDRPFQWNTTTTNALDDFTVTIDVEDLQQGTQYHYQFQDEDGHRSSLGTTRTLATHASTLHIAFLSCTSLWSGYFNFYRHLAADDTVDVVLHQGDIIYPEIDKDAMHRVPDNLCMTWDWFSNASRLQHQRNSAVRAKTEETQQGKFLSNFIRSLHCSSSTSILHRYRWIHSLYMLDPDLRAARAQHPFVVSLDNHDQLGYMSGRLPLDGSRKAAREWVPQRTQVVKPENGDPFEASLRHFRMGKNMLDIILLDTYGYSGDKKMKKEAGLLGDGQHEWLEGVLRISSESNVQWRLFGSGKTFMPFAINRLGRGFIAPMSFVFFFLLACTGLCVLIEVTLFSPNSVAYLELPQKQIVESYETTQATGLQGRRRIDWFRNIQASHACSPFWLRWCTAWSITWVLTWTVLCVLSLSLAHLVLNNSNHLKTLNPGLNEWEGQLGSMNRLFDQLDATATDSNNFWATGDMHYSFAADVFRFDATSKNSIFSYSPRSDNIKRYGVEMLPASGTRGNTDEMLGGFLPFLRPGSILSPIADLVTNHVVSKMNPHFRYFDGQSHGYGKLTVTSSHMEATFLQFPILSQTDEFRVGKTLYVANGDNKWSTERSVIVPDGGGGGA